MAELATFVPTLVGVGLLVIISIAVLWAFRAPHRFAPALAILRGTIQLAILSFILSGVITNPWWVALALVVMFVVAAVTATRRLGFSWGRFALVSASMALGIVVTAVIVFGTGAIELTARFAEATNDHGTGRAPGRVCRGDLRWPVTASGRTVSDRGTRVDHGGRLDHGRGADRRDSARADAAGAAGLSAAQELAGVLTGRVSSRISLVCSLTVLTIV